MQKFSNFQKLLTTLNKNSLNNFNKFIYKKFAFKNNNTPGIASIDEIGREYKLTRDRINSSIKPKTLSEIKKIKEFIKTTNEKGNLEE
jgi:hypothetical protein